MTSPNVNKIRLIGGIEISHSLTKLSRKDRADVVGAAIQRLLSRYGKTNYHVSRSISLIEKSLGFSPMWPCNNEFCEVKVRTANICIFMTLISSLDNDMSC